METEKFETLFMNRTNCMIYQAVLKSSLENEKGAGWIGGNAPAFFDDKLHLIHEGDLKNLFYMSFVSPFKPQSMISIFIPAESEVYLESNQYPHCAIKVIEHPVSGESTHAYFTHPDLVRHAIAEAVESDDQSALEQRFLIKLGGQPRLIQEETYYASELNKEAFSFYFQIDEAGYPETLLREHGSYPFSYGALYIFARLTADEIQEPVAGFWQFS